MSFRVIIAGSRYFYDYGLLCQVCDKILKNKRASGEEIIIVSGHAAGADVLGERYAKERKYACEIYPARWAERGKKAGPERNKLMAERADALIAFWNGRSTGTGGMIELARQEAAERAKTGGNRAFSIRVVMYEEPGTPIYT